MGEIRLTDKRRPIHVPRGLTKQINRRIRNFPYSPPPTSRDLLHPRRGVLLPREPLHAFCPAYGTWGDDVGGYASRAEFDGDGVGEGVNAGFRNANMSLHGGSGVVKRGRDEDYAAAERRGRCWEN